MYMSSGCKNRTFQLYKMLFTCGTVHWCSLPFVHFPCTWSSKSIIFHFHFIHYLFCHRRSQFFPARTHFSKNKIKRRTARVLVRDKLQAYSTQGTNGSSKWLVIVRFGVQKTNWFLGNGKNVTFEQRAEKMRCTSGPQSIPDKNEQYTTFICPNFVKSHSIYSPGITMR